MPLRSTVQVSGRAGFPVAVSRTFAPRYCQAAPPYGFVVASYGAITRLTRSRYPWSNSWLPTAETCKPDALRASIVGLSCAMNDSNVDAPIRSPAAANTVFGFSAVSYTHLTL